MAGLGFPIAGSALGLLGGVGEYLINKPKKPKPQSGIYLRQLQDAGLQTANQATANAGAQMAPALASRGLGQSGVGLSALSRIAGQGAQAATQGVQQGYLPALMNDQARQDDYDAANKARLGRLVSGAGESLGANVAGYGAIQAQSQEQDRTMALLRQIYGPEEFARLFGGGSRPVGAM